MFTLRLALNAAEPPAQAEADAPAAPIGAPLRVLAADDHAVNRRVVSLYLSQIDVTPTLAEDGASAVAAAESEPYDLILMDLHMPGMDGLAALRAIRAGGGPNAATPVIALTADAAPATITTCREAGMVAHVAKPIEPDKLFAAIRAAAEARPLLPLTPDKAAAPAALAAARPAA